uniref:ShKT domain-containing protein n=1 Tax=Onchocerca volvulus TaxID=6282 RepID=A0A8R1XWY5_ONCVO
MKKACRWICHTCYEGMNITRTYYDKEDSCILREMECFSLETAERMYHSCPETYFIIFAPIWQHNCTELTNYCAFSSWHQAVMKFRCRLTVYHRENFEPVECSDNISYCQYKRNLCERLEHQDEMRQDCSYTCKFCDYIEKATDISPDCQDGEMNCAKKRHLCYVEGPHSYYIWRNCKRTCGFYLSYNFNITSEGVLYSYY